MTPHAQNEEVARWEAALPVVVGMERLRILLNLAWHLRERDTHHALALADEAEAMLAMTEDNFAERPRMAARLDLVRAEAQRLYGDVAAATQLAERSLNASLQTGEALAAADAHWIMANVAYDCGQTDSCAVSLLQAAEQARAGGDVLRADLAEAAFGRLASHGGLQEDTPHRHQQQRFDDHVDDLDPALQVWVHDFLGKTCRHAGRYGQAAAHYMQGYNCAMATGQISRAVALAIGVGRSLSRLNEHFSAIEWCERGLVLARPTGWPASTGSSLLHKAKVLHFLGRLDEADGAYKEAYAVLQLLPWTTYAVRVLEGMGKLALERGDYRNARKYFLWEYHQADSRGQTRFATCALLGRADACLRLGQVRRALLLARHAHQTARDATYRFESLRMLARIHESDLLAPPKDITAPSPSLHYLLQARDLAPALPHFAVPASFFDELAYAYGITEQHETAFHMLNEANARRERSAAHIADERTIAQRMLEQTESVRANAELLRRRAVSETQRVQGLQQTSVILERLGAVGQEITAHLDTNAVFHALDRHVHTMLDAEYFGIYLFDADHSRLNFAFGVEAGKPVEGRAVDIANPSANSARCVREQREILIDVPEDSEHPNLVPDTMPMRSQLFAPLGIGERVVGVMSVQSPHRHAYGQRERLIFRTLCAYGAIALDNAAAYQQLEGALKTIGEAKAKLEEASVTDPLTGLKNRRYLLQHIEQDVADVLRRYDGPPGDNANKDLVFFMVDLDHFKSVNDAYGHSAGDALLVQMRARLEEVFRETDHIVRWGGEEFLIVARNADRGQAAMLAERAHAAVGERPFALPDGGHLDKTCSIGFACFPFLQHQPDALSWSQVVEVADQCLYHAKRNGRNGWIGAEGTPKAGPDILPRLCQDLRQTADHGEVLMYTSAAHRTSRENAESGANADRAIQRTIVRHNEPAPPGLALFDADGRVRRINQPFCDIFGYTEDALLDMSFRDLLHPDHHAFVAELAQHIAHSGIRDLSREVHCRRQDGEPVWVRMTVSSMRDRDDEYKPTFIVEDITVRREQDAGAIDLATHDALTGLPNRALLQDRLRQAIAAARQAHKQTAVIVLDLDNFKNVNDNLGRDIGDQVLREVSRRLSSHLRAVDTLARQGDDEFVVVLPNIHDQEIVATVAQKLLDALVDVMTVQGHEFFVGGSAGISLYPKDGRDGHTLLKHADLAMHRAKEASNNRFRFYAHDMNMRTLDRLKTEAGLRRALQRNELVLHYQPQVDLVSGLITGVEALVRWQPAGEKMIYPDRFISIAEDSGLIVPIGEWVLREACLQHRKWQTAGLPPIRISVNLSARQFIDQDVAALVARILDETECDASCLSLEITESVLMRDPASAVDTLRKLSRMGIHLSVDDFGTGYSSLSYLTRFPIDSLKIDRSFVNDVDTDSDNAAIIKAVVVMAHSLKLNVIAEGVETAEQMNFLKREQCNQIQGFFFSRPVPAEAMGKILAMDTGFETGCVPLYAYARAE